MSRSLPGLALGADRINELQMLHAVQEHQKELVLRVDEKQRWATQRRHTLNEKLSDLRRREAEDLLEAEQRRQLVDAEEKDLILARQRLDTLLSRFEMKKRDLDDWVIQRTRETEKQKQELEQDSMELVALEKHIEDLRMEITAHAREAEQRYMRRLEEAEATRRRWQEDAREVANLEDRLRSYTQQASSSPRAASFHPPMEGLDIDSEVLRIQRDITNMESRLAADVYIDSNRATASIRPQQSRLSATTRW